MEKNEQNAAAIERILANHCIKPKAVYALPNGDVLISFKDDGDDEEWTIERTKESS